MTQDLALDRELLYKGIGKIIVEFQFIEHEVADVLATLLQMHHPTDVHRITAAMSYAQKVDLMCDLHPDRHNPLWPPVDIKATRDALKAAEEFRNTVTHSFWYVSGADATWMRTKANLRSKNRLTLVTGKVNLDALVEGAQALTVIRDWYLGQTGKIVDATIDLRSLAKALNFDSSSE